MVTRGLMSTTGRMPSLTPTIFDSDVEPPHQVIEVSSFEELFTRYHPVVYGIALKFTGNPEDAEDITQEVFTKVWRNLDYFNHDASLKTWLYRIALNTCIDHSRKPWKKYGQHSSADGAMEHDEEDLLPSDEDSAERKLLVKETVAQVRQAITRLKPHLKSVLVLKDLEELSYGEISAILGVSLGTISSRLNRARKALQSLLGPTRSVIEES